MAITSRVYEQMFRSLATGQHNLYYDSHSLCLLDVSYVPDYAEHATYSDISSHEIAEGGGYHTGGARLVDQNTNQLADSYTLYTGPADFSPLTATFRYAVYYREGDSPQTSQLMVCVDFGEPQVYTGGELIIDFTGGVVVMRIPS